MSGASKIFLLLHAAHAALFRASERNLRTRHAIGTAQQAVLFSLSKDDGLPISQLATQLSMSKSSLTELISRIEASGLVRRAVNPCDARSVLVFLEESGAQIAASTLPDTKRLNDALLQPFDRTERQTIEKFLRHIADCSEQIVAEVSDPTLPSSQ